MNLTEKILAAHAGLDRVQPGEIVECRVDLVMAHDLTGPPAFQQLEKWGCMRIFDREKVLLLNSHLAPAKDAAAAGLMMALRGHARRQEIVHFWDEGQGGIEHAVLPEEGFVRPGMLIVGGDSHTTTYGALGAFATGMGSTDIAAAVALGETWLRVPEAMRATFSGQRAPFVSGKDLMLAFIGKVGADGARYMAVEFDGEAIRDLPVEQRLTMCNMGVEAGAKNAIIAPDGQTFAYLEGRARGPYTALYPDPDAVYAQEHRFDVAAMGPLVARPYSPDNVAPVEAAEGTKLDFVFIGSCTNARISDLRQAAAVLAGRKVARHTRLLVIPASQRIFRQALREGLIEAFLEAGAVVESATCGPCAGLHSGVVGAEERCLSTSNRNFPGRMGHPAAHVYLCNPFVAAASAVAGEIIHPRRVVPEEVGRLE